MEIKKFLTLVNFRKMSNKVNRFIVIHYTANNGDTAYGNCNYFYKINRGASANYFVDENEIYQCVEDSDVAWHVGSTKGYYNDCRNTNSIGIELCSRKDSNGKYYFKGETIKNAQNLTAYLMAKFNIPLQNVVMHYNVTHKICPEPFIRDPQQWEDFKDGIKWVDDLNYLEKMGRVNSDLQWVDKQIESVPNLKWLFTKWANDVRKLQE